LFEVNPLAAPAPDFGCTSSPATVNAYGAAQLGPAEAGFDADAE
jgi:hypothetical protein